MTSLHTVLDDTESTSPSEDAEDVEDTQGLAAIQKIISESRLELHAAWDIQDDLSAGLTAVRDRYDVVVDATRGAFSSNRALTRMMRYLGRVELSTIDPSTVEAVTLALKRDLQNITDLSKLRSASLEAVAELEALHKANQVHITRLEAASAPNAVPKPESIYRRRMQIMYKGEIERILSDAREIMMQ